MPLAGCSSSSSPSKGSGAATSSKSTKKKCPVECPTKAKFDESGTNYGFDDHTNSSVPWKSVEKGKDDTIKAELTPKGKYANVKFESSGSGKVTVSPGNASSDIQTVTVKGVNNGNSIIKATCDGSTLGKIKVKTYTKKTKTVAVRLVHEKKYNSTDVSDADIKSFLKKVYKQAVFEFKVTRLPAKKIAFDINKDKKVDVDSWMSDEMKKIRDECKDDSYDHNIFLVDNPSDGTTGFMDFNQRYGFVHAGTSGKPDQTMAHELGHGGFGLTHTPSDSNNVMYNYFSATAWRLRKDQWDKINP